MNIIKRIVPESKYGIKCPYEMKPTRIVVHNTANDASARNEINYMTNNNNEVSFHYAVDDKEIVQGIPENRNAWHSGDGNGKGNREGIAIEICYSLSGGERFDKAEDNAIDLIVDILKRYDWGIEQVTKHQDYSDKYCPHRILDNGWDLFIAKVKAKLEEELDYSIYDFTETINSVIEQNKYDYNVVIQLIKNYFESEENIYIENKNYSGTSIVDALNEINIDSSYSNRTKIAELNNISNYVGSAEQNLQLLSLLQEGKLINV